MNKDETDKAWENEFRQAKAAEFAAYSEYAGLRGAAEKAHEEYSRLRTIREKIDPEYAGFYRPQETPNAT